MYCWWNFRGGGSVERRDGRFYGEKCLARGDAVVAGQGLEKSGPAYVASTQWR